MESKKFTSPLLSLTRRHASVEYKGEVKLGKSITPSLELVVGDKVECEFKDNEVFILSFKERKNIFKRLYFGKVKNIASNIDRVYLVVAPKPEFNFNFVDNVLCEAKNENIDVTIVINKTDLKKEKEKIENFSKIYNKLGYEVIYANTIKDSGINEIKKHIEENKENQILLCGMSGVGKSSILNKLMDGKINQRVGDLSKRGNGKQTTSQSFGYVYKNKNHEVIIIDMPGIQNFNISFLEKEKIRELFVEFGKFSKECDYLDCLHVKENPCNVKLNVENNNIAESRYDSYVKIIQEIEDNKKY